MSEQVYVVPRAELFPAGAPHGFVRGCGAEWQRLLACIHGQGRFVDRGPAEEDSSLKQVIPYTLLVRDTRIFCFQRTRAGGERRLWGLRSVGVGGHINPEDGDSVVLDALRREVDEEMVVPAGWEPRLVGVVNDDSTPVGSVHLGVVAILEAPEGEVRVREADTMSGSFIDREELTELHRRDRAGFETWSALLLDQLDEVLAWDRDRDSSTPTRKRTPTSTT